MLVFMSYFKINSRLQEDLKSGSPIRLIELKDSINTKALGYSLFKCQLKSKETIQNLLTSLINKVTQHEQFIDTYLKEQFERTSIVNATAEMSLSLLCNHFIYKNRSIYDFLAQIDPKYNQG